MRTNALACWVCHSLIVTHDKNANMPSVHPSVGRPNTLSFDGSCDYGASVRSSALTLSMSVIFKTSHGECSLRQYAQLLPLAAFPFGTKALQGPDRCTTGRRFGRRWV